MTACTFSFYNVISISTFLISIVGTHFSLLMLHLKSGAWSNMHYFRCGLSRRQSLSLHWNCHAFVNGCVQLRRLQCVNTFRFISTLTKHNVLAPKPGSLVEECQTSTIRLRENCFVASGRESLSNLSHEKPLASSPCLGSHASSALFPVPIVTCLRPPDVAPLGPISPSLCPKALWKTISHYKYTLHF